MDNYLVFSDTVQFKIVDPKLVEIKDQFLTPQTQQTSNEPFSGKKGLLVRIAATHAGIITGNNTFYMPDKMKAGVPTFVENYQKPILLHHDENQDPIGRVIQARYVDTSGSVKDSQWFGKEIKDSRGRTQGTLNDKLIRDLCDGKMPFAMAVDVVRNILDNSILQESTYEGLGFAEITALITDKDAIEKFLDGRYLTGSVSASTDRAVCSHCKQDWTKDGKCDHTPGSVVDNKKVYLIAGNFNYSEYSMVNKPADRHSKVLELYYNGIKDSIVIAKDSNDRIYEVNVTFPQYEVNDQIQEDDLMSKKKEKTSEEAAKPEVKDSTEVPAEPKTEEQVAAPEGQAPVETPPTEIQNKESANDFFTRILDANYSAKAEDSEYSYALMLDAMKSLGLTDEEVAASKLSDEKRAKLPKSAFIGPNKTFPVTDATHALAASRLLEDYKGAADKAAMLAIVNRKAKVFGADKLVKELSARQTKVQDNFQCMRIMHQLLGVLEENMYTAGPEGTPPALSEEDVGAVQNLLKKLVTMVGKDSLAKAAGLEKLGLDSVAEQAFCDQISILEETVGSLRDELSKISEEKDALKEEYNTLFNEMNALQDSVVEANSSARKNKLARLELLTNLKEGVVKDRGESFATLSDEVISTQLETLSSEVDMKKIADKLNDGMSRTPNGTVENPAAVVVQDNKSAGKQLTKVEMDKIQAKYFEIKFKDKQAAERYLASEMNRLRREGKLPTQ